MNTSQISVCAANISPLSQARETCAPFVAITHSIRHRACAGITLVELMLGIMIAGVLSTIALASYQDYRARNDVGRAVTDLGTIQVAISTYAVDNQGLPQALSELGPQISGMKDPWGNAYQYIEHTTAKKGSFRKDKIFRPVNSDYDLFSMGKDGNSTANLNASQSRDDIVRGGNGRFLGLASDLDP